MRAFSISTRWSLIIFHLVLEGNAGRLEYHVKDPKPSDMPQVPEKKVEDVVIDISNSSNAECKSSADSSTSYQVCLTPGCTKAAMEILLNINENVDPCDDFFRFACGGWIDRHTIPDDKDITEVLSDVRSQINVELKVLMEKKLTGSEPEHVQIIKNMYDSCMDIEGIKALGVKRLDEFFEVLGGWPVLEGQLWQGKELDWIDILSLARKRGYGFNYLVTNTVFPSSDGLLISFEMTDRIYENGRKDPKAVANLEKMVETAVKLGANPIFARREMIDALKFEISLGKFTFPENSSVMDVSLLTLEQLKNQFPEIDLKKYIRKYLLGHRIPPNSTITAHVLYLTHFAKIMKNTEKRVLNNYILWRIADEYANAFFEVKEAGRWKYCLQILISSFGDAISSYYVNNYFDEKTKERIQDLITIQQREILDVFENSDWLDQDTKKHAMEKVNFLKSEIGYPDSILNDTAVSNTYREIGITNASFIDNYSKLRKRKIRENFKLPDLGHGNAVLFEGRHYPGSNSMFLAAALLHDPFYNENRPHYLNFGRVGDQVGHEILHAYDNLYFLLDKNGKLTEWKNSNTSKIFEEKVKCFVEQYQNYTLEDGFELKYMSVPKEKDATVLKYTKMTLNGKISSENIADSEGLKLAYKAYNTWVTKYGPEAQLPGLKYTPKQLFWISFASNFCAKSRPGYYERLGFHIHSPWEYRVAGPIANQPDFANDFKCPDGSNMNPKTKCQLW